MSDNKIVKASIHPSIGVARVGNSKADYFIGPEVPDVRAQNLGFYRDADGKLKRQAARFRIYGLNARDEVVKEITSDVADIEWNVHLANQKASWYQFQLALDIPEFSKADPSWLRNANIADRSLLTIDGGCKVINGKNKRQKFNGHFMGIDVYLGEAEIDSCGRLLVLGGHGKSASYTGASATTFANNDGWYDDIADGPVTAKVKYNGISIDVAPAWIVVAPPNYGPMQKSIRTMWDLMRDVHVSSGMLAKPDRPSLKDDIMPIFERTYNLQWVNEGFAKAFGWKGVYDFSSPEIIKQLIDPSPAYKEIKNMLYNQFRQYKRDEGSPVPLPWIYGDAMAVPASGSPRQYSILSDVQMYLLEKWANGEFVQDYDPDNDHIQNIEEVSIKEQPSMLDKAALDHCLADAFHPGCEMTWPMRHAGMYMSPYRIKHASQNTTEPNYGPQLFKDVINLPKGPILGGQYPGGITRWMAIPWQTDTASCRSGYDTKYDPFLPTFWPARVPNEVLAPKDYDVVMDSTKSLDERMKAFANRKSWFATLGLGDNYVRQINKMIDNFDKQSIVESRPGPKGKDSDQFPVKMQVADDITGELSAKDTQSLLKATKEKVDLSQIDKVRRFNND